MVKILIPTKPDDTDSIFVKLALERKGHECTIWYTADFPGKQTHSFEFEKNKISWKAKGINLRIDADDHYDVVWLRRPGKPRLPASIHPEDLENARNENNTFFRSFWHMIAPDAFWVNPIDTSLAANNKLLQLKIAREAGFNIPTTLITNDPGKIKTFIIKHHKKGVIFKTLFPVVWMGEREMRLTYTDEIKLDDLPSDEILQCTPGIFQNKIQKQFELRVTCFGDHLIAAKLKSQQHPKGIMDWRYVPANELAIEEFKLPEEIASKCRQFMKKLGLAMGCFDFIVTPENEYYFLEINEQGQFLWVESINPDIKMLDAFTEFLINGKSDFNYQNMRQTLSMTDFKDEILTLKCQAMDKHVAPDSIC